MNSRRDPNSSIEISTSRLLQGISAVFLPAWIIWCHSRNDTRRLACFAGGWFAVRAFLCLFWPMGWGGVGWANNVQWH